MNNRSLSTYTKKTFKQGFTEKLQNLAHIYKKLPYLCPKDTLHPAS